MRTDEFLCLTLLSGSGAVLLVLFINQLFDPQRRSRYLCNEGNTEHRSITSSQNSPQRSFSLASILKRCPQSRRLNCRQDPHVSKNITCHLEYSNSWSFTFHIIAHSSETNNAIWTRPPLPGGVGKTIRGSTGFKARGERNPVCRVAVTTSSNLGTVLQVEEEYREAYRLPRGGRESPWWASAWSRHLG